MSVPLIKLGYLVVRTLSKPIANSLKQQAVTKPAFRAVCFRIAQTYHRMEVNMKHTLKNGQPVKPLEEHKAIEFGANFLGELVIFTIAGTLLTIESIRSSRNEANRKERLQDQVDSLEVKVQQLEELMRKT